MIADQKQIPVTILTGFLGSGKTTSLNTLLAHRDFRDTAIIVNEFGKIGLDHDFLVGATDKVILLDDGCVCCAVLETFRDTLMDLHTRRQGKEVPPFSKVLMETTGMADPGPILHALATDPVLLANFVPGTVITTVDAKLAMVELDRYHESRRQVALADILVITKLDVTGGVLAPALAARLRDLNPTAQIEFGVSALDPNELYASSATFLKSDASNCCDEGHDHAHSHAHALSHAEHSANIRSQSFEFTEPVPLAALNDWVSRVSETFGERLLRCKGLIHVVGHDYPLILQGVQGDFFPYTSLDRWPDGKRRSQLVLISEDISSDDLQAVLPPWMFDNRPELSVPASG